MPKPKHPASITLTNADAVALSVHLLSAIERIRAAVARARATNDVSLASKEAWLAEKLALRDRLFKALGLPPVKE